MNFIRGIFIFPFAESLVGEGAGSGHLPEEQDHHDRMEQRRRNGLAPVGLRGGRPAALAGGRRGFSAGGGGDRFVRLDKDPALYRDVAPADRKQRRQPDVHAGCLRSRPQRPDPARSDPDPGPAHQVHPGHGSRLAAGLFGAKQGFPGKQGSRPAVGGTDPGDARAQRLRARRQRGTGITDGSRANRQRRCFFLFG